MVAASQIMKEPLFKTSNYRHRVIIEQATESSSANGVVTQTWATYYKCRAAIIPLNGNEYYQSKQVAADVTTRFRLLYCSKSAGITAKMRINWNSTYFDIESVINPLEANKEIIIRAIKKNA